MTGLELRLDTPDVDAAREQVARTYCPHTLTVTGHGFHARHTEAGAAEFGVSTLTYGSGSVQVTPQPFGDFVLVSRVTAGEFVVDTGPRRTVVSCGAVIALDAEHQHVLHFGAGCALVTVRLSLPLLRRAASDHRLRPGLLSGHPLDPGPWDAVTRFLVRDAAPSGLLDSPLSAAVAQLAAAAAWQSFAPPASEATSTSADQVLDRALTHIADHAHEQIGLLDIATVAGVSPRRLQEVFRARTGSTPMEHLRAVRLHRVRADLLAGRGSSVADIAWRWGFGNLGRFARAYRTAYGHLPSADYQP